MRFPHATQHFNLEQFVEVLGSLRTFQRFEERKTVFADLSGVGLALGFAPRKPVLFHAPAA